MKLVKHNLEKVAIEVVFLYMSDKDFSEKVKEFSPDVVIAESSIENVVAIDKALSNLCAIGLYKPSLDDIHAFDIKNKPIPKIIYCDNDYYKNVFEEYGEVVNNEVDYFDKCDRLVFNIVG